MKLRTFTEDSEVVNTLGVQYEIVLREASESYPRFAELFEEHFGKAHIADDCATADEHTKRTYAFILNDKEGTIPLYKGQKNYIVSDSGKTFDNLTYKTR